MYQLILIVMIKSQVHNIGNYNDYKSHVVATTLLTPGDNKSNTKQSTV